jgi:primosomal protein N' (replication factor Y) (superfamily II helicase)
LQERRVEVALPVPVYQTFTYSVPAGLDDRVRAGSRVVVQFRNRDIVGIVQGETEGKELKRKPRTIKSVPDDAPAVDARMLELCEWIAEYYVIPLGIVLRAALPAALTGTKMSDPPRKTRRVIEIVTSALSLSERDSLFGRAKQQRGLFELLESLGGRSSLEHLTQQLNVSASVVKALEARGLVAISSEDVERDPFASRERAEPSAHTPTQEQIRAIQRLGAAEPGEVFLLHGVTGSGKTLVYMELLRKVVLQEGKGAIVLVPEIALTPQTVDRFRAVFGDAIAVLHSALSDGERYDAWLALQRGDKRIAVGARSAIFAPVRNLGAIILDEEHEASYKQGENPRYHAREVAIVRARMEGATVVLGSATPSLESWVNAGTGKFELLTLPHRVGGARLPRIEVVDLREKKQPGAHAAGPTYDWVIRAELDAALRQTLERGEQSILLLNRRGYSSFVQCMECGHVIVCPNCSITLTHHRAPERLVCHYCMHQEGVPEKCVRCAGVTMQQRGLGTQQVERLLCERFPSARIARMDVDTTSGKWAHTEILDRVGAGTVDILLGTQMIAKGLDFPNVTLVGVVDADVGINLPDFRASERCYQLLAQVAGRAGRGAKGGRVLIQTRVPDHHAVRCALNHDYAGFVREELDGRVSPPYPPNTRLANIVFSGAVEEDVAALAIAAAQWLRDLVAHARGTVEVVGPAPSAIERIKNRWRWHVLLKSENPAELTRVGRYFMERFEIPAMGQLRITLDRDPVTLL